MAAINTDKKSLVESLDRLENEIKYSKEILIDGFPKEINFSDEKKIEEETIMKIYRNLQYLELSILKYLKGDDE